MPAKLPDPAEARRLLYSLRIVVLLAATLLEPVPGQATGVFHEIRLAPTRLAAIPDSGPAGAATIAVVLPYAEEASDVSLASGGNGLKAAWAGNARWLGYSLAFVSLQGGASADDWPPDLVLRLQTRKAPEGPSVLARHRPKWERLARQQVMQFVANPADVARYAAPNTPHAAKGAGRGFAPSAYPELEGSPVDYLILTDASLVDAFQPLADWKTARGVPTVVRSTAFALANARAGSDPGATLRNFIRDAYQLWGIRWVLLGGDTNFIPARFAYSAFVSPPTQVPSDLYYACLDGDWNANGNDRFAEAAVSAQDLGDRTDLLPEVYVSRAPVTTVAEAQLFVQKSIGYETPLSTNYQGEALFLAEVLSPAAYDSGATITLDGASLSDDLINEILPPALNTERLYETWWLHPGSSGLSKSIALDSLTAGPHFVNHMGHGFRFNMSVADASIVNPEAEALTNGNRAFVLFLLNCTALAFDSNALGERFLLAPGGGAVAAVGSSRGAFPNSSILYNRQYYQEIFAGNVHFGQALALSRLPRTVYTFFETQDRWTHLILNGLGDPELMLYSGLPRSATVTYADSVGVETASLLVHVEAASMPVDSARVCLQKGDEVYAVDWTDASGDVTLAVRFDTAGAAVLTVSGQDLMTYQDSITVVDAPAAHLFVAGLVVDDDASGPSNGNGDGQLDVGETVELTVQVGNAGLASAAGLWARLVSPVGQVAASVDSVVFGDVLPLGPTVAGTFVFSINANVAEKTLLTFDLQFADSSGAALGSETLHKQVHAPSPEVVEVLRAANGPTSEVRLVLKNFGSGTQSVFNATLGSTDPDVSILSANSAFPAITSFASDTCLVPFQVSELDTTQRNFLDLNATDAYGRELSFRFELRAPAAPAAPVLDASVDPTSMRLTWSPNLDADELGYHVYRRLAGTSSFERATVDFVRATYFLDTGLLPSTRYDFVIVALDSSRQQSTVSPVATASTNPKQLAGWPLPMRAATSSSVAVGDIDGDGDLEIVVGDDGVYAWHADGTEVRDGDNDALTWGVFIPSAATVAASIALGDVDPARPGLEIVAARWASNEIYVYDSQGNVLPGWPVQPNKGGAAGFWGAPTAVDLTADGAAEILAISKDGWLYGFGPDGAPLVGSDGAYAFLGAFTRTSPAVLNLDADVQLEIVVGGADGYLRAFDTWGAPLTEFNGQPANWPINLGGAIHAAPSVGDLDGIPSTPEIVVMSENDKLYVIGGHGFTLAGWPKSLPVDSPSFAPSPALGDLNNDGVMDIVVVSNEIPATATELRAYDGATGALLLQQNLGNWSESSPVLADLDGNGSVDILVGGESGVIQAWDTSGAPLDGFPLTVGDFVRSTPTVCDLDGDGDIEIALSGWDQSVYVWDLEVPFDRAKAPWPSHHRDVQRSNNALLSRPTDPSGTLQASPPARLVLLPNVPNPFNPSTRVRFSLPQADRVRVHIYDTRGRLVRELCNDRLTAGMHELLWDGRDQSGRTTSSGVYWVRVRTAAEDVSGKTVLVR